MNDDALTYGIGSIIGGVLSYFWETAGFGLFIAVISFFSAIYAYSEAEKNNSNKGIAIWFSIKYFDNVAIDLICDILSESFSLEFLQNSSCL
jgi:hypothetical protein